MNRYKITYTAGKNEHVIELEAENKEQAGRMAREQLGNEVKILDVVHIPEHHALF